MEMLNKIGGTSMRSIKTVSFEIIGAKGAARFRMAPLDLERVKDLFEEHDLMQSLKLAA